MKMIDIFNETFGIPEGTPFKRIEVEDWFIENLRDIHIDRFKALDGQIFYHVKAAEDWGIYSYSTKICTANSIEDAFIDVILKNRQDDKNLQRRACGRKRNF